MHRFLLPLCVHFLFTSTAYGDCGWNAARNFFSCGDSVTIASSVGRTLPVLTDSVRFNPASIPSVLTPIGVEATYSTKTVGDHHFQPSLIKGFPGVGFSLVSWTENDFATPNIQAIIKSVYNNFYSSYQGSTGTGYRFGGSFALPFIPFAHIAIGASMGKGRVPNSQSLAYGITADSGFLSLGYAQNSETLVRGLPLGVTKTISGGLSYGGFYLGLSQMKFSIAQFKTATMTYISMRMALKNFATYIAMKNDVDASLQRKNYFTGNIQYSVFQNFVLGYVYGLYPDAHSVSAQLYF